MEHKHKAGTAPVSEEQAGSFLHPTLLLGALGTSTLTQERKYREMDRGAYSTKKGEEGEMYPCPRISEPHSVQGSPKP